MKSCAMAESARNSPPDPAIPPTTMRPASRFMPPVQSPRPLPWLGRVFLAMAACGLLWIVWAHPVAVGAAAVALWALAAAAGHIHAQRFTRMALQRPGESLCQFARALDCRTVDTWVVRAVYEELQRYLPGAVPLPLRITDHLQHDLRLDAEDLDEVILDMAQRAGRDLTNTSSNPLYDKVITVGDLVHFLNAQPRLG